MHFSSAFVIARSSQVCTFPGSLEMALSIGVVGKDEETGRADLRRGESSLAMFLACLGRNPKESPEWRKMKMCVLLLPFLLFDN